MIENKFLNRSDLVRRRHGGFIILLVLSIRTTEQKFSSVVRSVCVFLKNKNQSSSLEDTPYALVAPS